MDGAQSCGRAAPEEEGLGLKLELTLMQLDFSQDSLNKFCHVVLRERVLIETAIGTDLVAEGDVEIKVRDGRIHVVVFGKSRLTVLMMEEHELGGKLLAGVSRSFYLTLKALPEGMREPLSLGYLLARASDTLADTLEVPNETRLELLNLYQDAVLQASPDLTLRETLFQQISEKFLHLQKDENERLLLERLKEAFDALDRSKVDHQHLIRQVLIPILRGQIQDVSWFSNAENFRSFQTVDQLDEYTYCVAGCVGEFWTNLGLLEFGEDFSSNTHAELLLKQGIHFGKALQLVNILRDIGKDAKLGRCYFPEDEIVATGFSLTEIQEHPEKLREVVQHWMDRAESYFDDALAYVESLKQPRVRLASALPLLLGVKTLKLIRQASDETWLAGVKVTRTDVAKVLMDAGFANMKQLGYRKWMEKHR